MTPTLRLRAALSALSDADRRLLLDRSLSVDPTVRQRTAELITQVRERGDAALRDFARRFDGVELTSLEVPRSRWQQALERLDPQVRAALARAQKNIAAAHRAFIPQAVELETEPGVVVGRRPDPLQRVGVYAPGGRAPYPSSVLMGVVPAKVVGVGEVILCSPPGKDGVPSDVVLAAAELAGVDRVFALGGAGAVAALAYGTGSVPRVDRIVGPGNAYVAEAKLQVAGAVAIDAPAGPSEILVLADASADPEVVAREMLAQAEHDPDACVVTVAVGQELADRVAQAILRNVERQPRRELIERALAARGAVLWVDALEAAWPFVEQFAPEHLLLATRDAARDLSRVRNAGTVFVGQSASVAFGDYLTGANHTLPTGGLAHAYSGLSTLEYVRWTSYQRVSPKAAAALADDVEVLARSEGLAAHAEAGSAWRNKS